MGLEWGRAPLLMSFLKVSHRITQAEVPEGVWGGCQPLLGCQLVENRCWSRGRGEEVLYFRGWATPPSCPSPRPRAQVHPAEEPAV